VASISIFFDMYPQSADPARRVRPAQFGARKARAAGLQVL
jgi:hypothetical protein